MNLRNTRIAEMFANRDQAEIAKFMASLSNEDARRVLDDWDLWAMPHQRMPEGDWRRWIIRAGRGSGKTEAGARSTNLVSRDSSRIKSGEIGIIGRTYEDVRAVCVEGPSGILATAPNDWRPTWQPGKGLLTWPNGVRGSVFSGDAPDGIRGRNFAWVWGDEICFWPNPSETWWAIIEPALRIGWARALITTTPKPFKFLKELEAMADTVLRKATTYDNPFLSDAARQAFIRHYKTSRLGKQELLGEYLDDNPNALWKYETIDDHRAKDGLPNLVRIVVAVDPAVTSGADSNETGIIVVGIGDDDHVYVLADYSGKYPPTEWGLKVVQAYRNWNADRIIGEVNQGGDMVEMVIRAVDPNVAYESVHASRGKVLRAEPVAALYERELVHHVGVFPELETQMTEWVPGQPSPDRVDALVHGITAIKLGDETPIGPITAYL